jgi:hypothetical protein
MDAPTIREVLKGKQTCGPWRREPCDYEREIDEHERDQAVDDLIERLERIETALGLPK